MAGGAFGGTRDRDEVWIRHAGKNVVFASRKAGQ